jgi:DNA-binding transcriptional MerR regulator
MVTIPDEPTGPASLTISEFATRAGVSRQAVHGWIARGRLRATWTDDGIRVDAAEAMRYLAARRAAESVGISVDTLLHLADQLGEQG